MTLTVVVISLLAAPRAPADAEVVAYLPKVEQVAQLMPFLKAAGSRSALLRPEAWQNDVHPLISVDVTSPESLALVGIDATKSVTSSRLDDASIACVTVSDVRRYRQAADARLARMGEVFEKVEGGVAVYGSRDSLGRVLGAYLLQGRESCAISGHGRSVEKQFPALSKAVARNAAGPGYALAAKLPGVAQLISPAGSTPGVLSLSAKDLSLVADGRTKGAPFLALAGAGASPFGAFSPSGMAVFRARAAKAQLPGLVEQVAAYLPGGAALAPLAREVAPLLTGHTAALISHVRVTSGLRTKEARFFALRFALLAEVTDAAAVSALLAKLDARGLASREGTLTISLEGTTLVVANDPEVKARALKALEKGAGSQAHGLEFEVDAKLVAKGLQQVPLLEAVQAPELAGLVAIGSELGPLLLATERIHGHLDSTGASQHAGRVTWSLDAAKFKPDAGQRSE